MTHCCWQWPNTAVSISWPCSVKFGQSWLVSCAYSVRNCIASQVLHATTVDGTCCDRDILLLNMLRQVSTQPSQWDTVSKPSSDTAKLPSPNIDSRWLELTTPYIAPARNNEVNINCYMQIIMMTTQDNLHPLWCASRDTHTNSMTQSATTSLLDCIKYVITYGFSLVHAQMDRSRNGKQRLDLKLSVRTTHRGHSYDHACARHALTQGYPSGSTFAQQNNFASSGTQFTWSVCLVLQAFHTGRQAIWHQHATASWCTAYYC